MSNNTAANAAALAAFNAIGKKKDDSPDTKKPLGLDNTATYSISSAYSSKPTKPIRNPVPIKPTSKPNNKFAQLKKVDTSPHGYKTTIDLVSINININKTTERAKAIPNNALSKRISTDYSPQEMLKNLRQSINAKSKTSPVLQPSERGQLMLTEMRDRLDNTRKIASTSMGNLAPSPGLELSRSHTSTNNYFYRDDDDSDESFTSFDSHYHGRELPHGISIDITKHDDDDDDDDEGENDIDNTLDFVEGKLEYDGEEDEEEDEDDAAKQQDVKSNTDKLSISSRLKRKPPPGEEDGSSGSYSLNPGDLYSLTDQELHEMLESPQVAPVVSDLSDSSQSVVDSEVEEPPSNVPLRSSTPLIGQQQTVQFRSTMRKANKRKDKKFMFDELKPWKNHSELNYLTDQEKKRYEGVWVSNRGNYMKNVMIKLNGVNYDAQKEEPHPTPAEEGHSKTAAKLSSIPVGDNHNTLHNLDSAEIEQLMCGSVVKRIWKRSRLPNDILEQIWNLVDFRRDGTLNKNEFIVGMWLVDQCLYGRKLPKQVDKAVWDSLGGIGVNVNINVKKKK
ncbi:Increased rDNA silencing protein 4 [Candida viswanathii]|uniref:Increased rDNA silencing protein 4 n=1 Tax=Candida viswanathii TaxID=5486 RepID=A0A367XUJ8_9ASCO|nr:Increased rDNA silencing protein 4 [Candida viswanathii]